MEREKGARRLIMHPNIRGCFAGIRSPDPGMKGRREELIFELG